MSAYEVAVNLSRHLIFNKTGHDENLTPIKNPIKDCKFNAILLAQMAKLVSEEDLGGILWCAYLWDHWNGMVKPKE